ncbi:hypothetical protein LZD49_33630 [Dyadobacter sp. CY261]|uniref:hypothetical protein n=1 Tax=Dyadobacter sp. CY261 TaxID=2907203 RepID=UPI001F35C2D9|nr:hypothetical protein [Dyadobacter sp. CY261]MCF0075469.1 hypothetical protein [Dyadobacter sp. CY261]
MSDNIVQLVILNKPFVLSNGLEFTTKNELNAYIKGIEFAQGNINAQLEILKERALFALEDSHD